MESSASLPHHTPLLPLLLLLLIAPWTLLCQSYRGSEWAWSSIDASGITLGGFRLPSLLPCGCTSSTPQPSTPSFAHGSKPSLPHFSSSFVLIIPTWPRLPRHHQSFTPSKDQHRLPSPPTFDLVPQLSRRLSRCRHPISQSSAYGLPEVNGELQFSFPHAFLTCLVQGVQGTRLHMSYSQRHSS